MSRAHIVVVVGVLMALKGTASFAADATPRLVKAPLPPWTWTGFYVGGHVGGGAALTRVADPYGPSMFGDGVRSPNAFAGVQLGYNWQLAESRLLFGLEADLSAVGSDGTNTCLAFSGLFVSANCRVRPDVIGSLGGRVGYAFGPSGRTLLYAKGGAAWVRDIIDITTNNLFNSGANISTSDSRIKWGWTVGAGVEQALTPAWSLKLEYDYSHFGGVNVATPASEMVAPDGATTTVPASTSGATQQFHLVKVGVNYRWGTDPATRWDSAAAPVFLVKVPPRPAGTSGWEVEIGPRYWYDFSLFHWDNAGAVGDLVQSRLTYDDRKTNAGELFGRVDSPWGIFVKGFVGGGGETAGGHMNDEDWGIQDPGGAAVAYTNTRHGKVDGSIRYATADVGYSWLEDVRYKVGTFVGYNYFKEKMNAFGCVQIASPGNPDAPCAPGNPNFQPIPIAGAAVITERAEWQSLRLGVVADYLLTDRLKLTAEAAYLPYVKFTGEDNHFGGNSGVLTTVFPQAGHGAGVQLEAMLSYALTEQFSVGVGGRYWAMWTTRTGYCGYDPSTPPCTPSAPAKAATEQVGVLVQASYKFNVPADVD